MIVVGRRGATAVACAVALGGVLAACGNGDTGINADGPSTSVGGRFPAAVVSTTTPAVTTPFGGTVKPTTTTTRKGGGSSSGATTTTSAGQTPARVRPAATPMPAPRTGLAGVAWQGFVIVAGGIDSSGDASKRVDAYDPASGTWQRGPDLPGAVHDAALAVLGNELWVIGGLSEQGDQSIAQATTYRFDTSTNNWTAGPNLQTPRGGPAVATVGDTLVVVGGETTDGGDLDTVETLKAGADAFADAPPLAQKRGYATALVVGGRVYAIGGRDGGVSNALGSVESWKPGEGNWSAADTLNTKRTSAASSANCVAGGENGDGAVGSVECLNANRKWTTAFRMDVPRHGLAAAVVDGWLHLIGGGPRPGLTVNAAHEVFDLTS